MKEGQNLVIVESPAKAGTIQKFLGSEYTVKSSYGHIRDLQDNGLSIDVKNGFAPQYVVPADKKKTVSDLKKAAKEAEDAAKKANDAPKASKSSKLEGALPGVFTLKDGKKIRFAQGNLQFNPKKYEFRFAKEQYEILGKPNIQHCLRYSCRARGKGLCNRWLCA